MTKRIIAALFALILVLGLCSCTKSDKQKPVPDKILASKSSQSTSETEKTSASEASGSSKTQTSKENKTSQTMKSVTLSNSDKQYFEKMMSYIVGYGLTDMGVGHEEEADYVNKFYDYDCTSGKALNYALNIIFAVPYESFVDDMAQIYDWRDYDELWYIVNEDDKNEEDDYHSYIRDPKKLFKNGEYYCVVESSYVDKILKNVFNVKPDHSVVMKNSKGNVWLYYYDGNYYYVYGDGGDGAGPLVTLDSVKQRADGKYIIEAKHKYGNDDEGYSFRRKLKIVADIKIVDGDSLWSIYKIETVK
jgi:hypothetical protein